MRRSLGLALIATALVAIPTQEAWASAGWTDIGSVAYRSDGTQLRLDRGCDVIRIDVDKLQEVTPGGKVVASVHLNGRVGSWGQFQQTDNTHSATLTGEHKGAEISLTTHLARAASETCDEDTLGFSMSVVGWSFQSPDNRLHFTVRTASFDAKEAPLRQKAASGEERLGAPKLNLCTTDTADGRAREVGITVTTIGAWTHVTFDFPQFTRRLLYECG